MMQQTFFPKKALFAVGQFRTEKNLKQKNWKKFESFNFINKLFQTF